MTELADEENFNIEDVCEAKTLIINQNLQTKYSVRESYEQSIKECCYPDPIIDTKVITGEEQYEFVVKVYKANYGNFLYYYFGCSQPKGFLSHPFRYINDDYTEIYNVIADNELTRMIFTYIIMPEDDLQLLTGHTLSIDYRAKLIKSITMLWD